MALSRVKPAGWYMKLQPGRLLEPIVRAIPGGSQAVDRYNEVESRVKAAGATAQGILDAINAEAKARGVSPEQVAREKGADVFSIFNRTNTVARQVEKYLPAIGLGLLVLIGIVVWKRGA